MLEQVGRGAHGVVKLPPGRDVVRYRQRPGDGSTVEWYVLFERTVQVSVGCRAKPSTAADVERACRNVVASLQVQP